MPKKTWVIPAGNTPYQNGGRGAWTRPRISRNRFAKAEELPSPTQRRSDLPTAQHPGRTLTLAYFLGPLGACVTESGRGNLFWLLTGITASVIGLLSLWQGQDMPSRLQHGSGYGMLWLTLWATSWIGVCLAWSRGVTMAGLEVKGGMNRLPKGLGNPWVVGIFGAIFPGYGLLLAGYPRRAGLAILSCCALCLGLLVLLNGHALWKWNKISHYGGFPVTTLEMAYLAALGLTLLGAVGWLVQMLDGVRLAQRKTYAGSDHGDAFAFALMAAIAVFAAVFRPAAFAAEFDHVAEWGEQKGFRVIPITFATAAMHLDPSRPDYALRAASIHESMGHKRTARELRADLHGDWAIYRAFAEPIVKRPEMPKVETTVVPSPVATTVQSAATGAPATMSQKPLGPEPPPVAQSVAEPPSPVKITAGTGGAAQKTTAKVTKPTTKSGTKKQRSATTSKTP